MNEMYAQLKALSRDEFVEFFEELPESDRQEIRDFACSVGPLISILEDMGEVAATDNGGT